MRTDLRCITFFLLGLATALGITACSADSSSWYPSGKATVVSYYEALDGSTKTCQIAIKIENTGKSVMDFYTISLSVTTDLRMYYKTITEKLTILPKKSAYANVQIVYGSESETLKTNGLVVLDEYYK